MSIRAKYKIIIKKPHKDEKRSLFCLLFIFLELRLHSQLIVGAIPPSISNRCKTRGVSNVITSNNNPILSPPKEACVPFWHSWHDWGAIRSNDSADASHVLKAIWNRRWICRDSARAQVWMEPNKIVLGNYVNNGQVHTSSSTIFVNTF